MFSHTSPRENIVNYSPWVIDHQGVRREVKVTGGRQSKHVIAKLEGVSNRDQAEELGSATIFIRRDQLAKLDEGEYYWAQLIGLEVVNGEGTRFGTIDHMLETGANDVMVVQGDRERLIPFVIDEVVSRVDLDNGRVIVDWDADY